MSSPQTFFSIIICTCGRKAELELLLQSIRNQKCDDSEIIIFDHNSGNGIEDIVSEFNDLNIILRKRPGGGLSESRNMGIEIAKGEYCAFPDDDCIYPDGELLKIKNKLEKTAVDALSCLIVDTSGKFSSGGIMSRKKWIKITQRNAWTCGNSSGLFIRREALQAIGGFNTHLGIGAKTDFQSGEDTEILLRMITGKMSVFYTADSYVVHPKLKWQKNFRRAYLYGCGGGWVLAHYKYTLSFVLLATVWKIFSALLAVLRFRFAEAVFHIAMGIGKLVTYLKQR